MPRPFAYLLLTLLVLALTSMSKDVTVSRSPFAQLLIAQTHLKQAFFHTPEPIESSAMKRAFALLFPFQHPAYNSILATFYISSIPNFILIAVPSALEPSSLNTMIAFATGGLLGDVFLHLVPHAFFGEVTDGTSKLGRMVVVEEKRNIVIGYVGLMHRLKLISTEDLFLSVSQHSLSSTRPCEY